MRVLLFGIGVCIVFEGASSYRAANKDANETHGACRESCVFLLLFAIVLNLVRARENGAVRLGGRYRRERKNEKTDEGEVRRRFAERCYTVARALRALRSRIWFVKSRQVGQRRRTRRRKLILQPVRDLPCRNVCAYRRLHFTRFVYLAHAPTTTPTTLFLVVQQ